MKKQMRVPFSLLVILLSFGIADFAASRNDPEGPPLQTEQKESRESVYTVQAGSFMNTQRAEQQFMIIKQSLEEKALQALRIELIGDVYAVRIGKFSRLAEAEQFLGAHELNLKESIVMKAYFIEKRILKMYKSEDAEPAGTEESGEEARNLTDIPGAAHDLGLRLIGTVLSDETDASMAIIETLASGDREVYKEGDTVHGVLIKRILSRRILIDSGIGDAMLVMAGNTGADTFQPETEKVRLEQKEVDAAVTSRLQMIQMLRLKPYRQKGRIRGFMIYNVEPESIFQTVGFEDGDIITAVKGKPLMTKVQAAQFYQALRQGGNICVDIRRNDSDLELCFEIR